MLAIEFVYHLGKLMITAFSGVSTSLIKKSSKKIYSDFDTLF